MQPSGQAWAQVEQPVQRSSNQRRLVRALTGTGRISSGYWVVKGVRKRVRRVTIIPLAIPVPNKRAPSRRGRALSLPDVASVAAGLKPRPAFRYPQGKLHALRFAHSTLCLAGG